VIGGVTTGLIHLVPELEVLSIKITDNTNCLGWGKATATAATTDTDTDKVLFCAAKILGMLLKCSSILMYWRPRDFPRSRGLGLPREIIGVYL